MRIAIAQILHESNTFSKVKTTESAFKGYEWLHHEKILKHHKGVKSYVGGMIDQGEALGVDLVPTFSAFCNPSGMISQETYESLQRELVSNIQEAGKLDAICLALHGAGVVEGVEDLEGQLLKALRAAVGYEIPIVVTLDLHANMTELMVSEANIILGVHYYPHTDTYDRGVEAMDLAVKMVSGSIRPTMALKKIPMLIFPSNTYQTPAKDINERCWDWENEDGVIDCTFFHGFARSDISDLGASVITITENNSQLAHNINEDVSQEIWRLRDLFTYDYPTSEEGVKLALQIEGKPIVMNETSDNPGGGAPGDGTFLLQALLDKNEPYTCLGSIYDPETAELAHRHGVGSTIDVRLGGKSSDSQSAPVVAKAYVKSLTDGKFNRSSPMSQGARINVGKSARLQIGNVDIIVCSVKGQTFDEQVFLLHGIDITEYKIVALKSSQHFRASFQPIAKKIITVDSPGITTSNVSFYPYQNVRRPIYPLDRDFTY